MIRALAKARGYDHVGKALRNKWSEAWLFGTGSDQSCLLLVIDASQTQPTNDFIRTKCLVWWKRFAETVQHVVLITKDGAGSPVHQQRLSFAIHRNLPLARHSATVQVEHVDEEWMIAADKPAECSVERNAEPLTITEIRWLVRCALIRMIYDRGYELDEKHDAENCITWKQFEALGVDRKERDHLTLWAIKGKENMITMYRESDFSRDFGKEVSEFVRTMNVPRVVLVTGKEKPLPKNIDVELRRLRPQFFIHSLTCAELLISRGVLFNDLVFKHKVATAEEVTVLRDQFRLTSLAQLPGLQDTDFLARYFGLLAGKDVVQISRHSATAGTVTYWRGVIDSQMLEGASAHMGKAAASNKHRPWKLEGEAGSKEAKAEFKEESKEESKAQPFAFPQMPVGWQPPAGFGGSSSTTQTTGDLGEEL